MTDEEKEVAKEKRKLYSGSKEHKMRVGTENLMEI